MPTSKSDRRPVAAFPLSNLFAFAAALLLLGACSGETPVEQATREGILLMGNSAEPKGFDPHIVSGVLENHIISSMFEGLVDNHPSEDGIAAPGVAERWEANEDSSVWTFHLRKDALWSDGQPVAAEDFLFGFKRLLSPGLASDYSFMLYYIVDAEAFHKTKRTYLLTRDDPDFTADWDTLSAVDFSRNEEVDKNKWPFNVKGLDFLNAQELEQLHADPELFQWPETVQLNVRASLVEKSLAFAKSGKEVWDLIDFGASAPDPHTLVVRLNGPLPFLPEITKHYTWFPVPKHVVLRHGKIDEPFTSWTKPGNIVTNGPFKLKSWRINDHVEVEKSPTYWNAETVSLNGIRFLPIINSYTEARMFRNNQLHITYTLAPEMIGHSKKHMPDNVRTQLYLGTYFARCNVDSPAFGDPRVRKAFSLAIDQRSIIDNVTLGNQQPASGLVPPFGDYTASKTVSFDPERARALLEEAGYPGGKGLPDIEFLTTDQDSAKALSEALQAMWREHLGVTVKIKQMEWTSYLSTMFEQKYDLAAGGWIGDYLDPLTFLDMWIKDGGNNRTGWSNQEFEAILDRAGQGGDATERYRLLKEAEELFLSEQPILPIYWYTRNYLISKDVEGWHPLILDNHPYKHVRLKPSGERH